MFRLYLQDLEKGWRFASGANYRIGEEWDAAQERPVVFLGYARRSAHELIADVCYHVLAGVFDRPGGCDFQQAYLDTDVFREIEERAAATRQYLLGRFGLPDEAAFDVLRVELRQEALRLAESRRRPGAGEQVQRFEADSKLDDAEQYVKLDDAAAMVNRSKRTLEKYAGELPPPDVEGGGGKPHEWKWSTIRPWLEKQFNRKLSERFPRTAGRN